MTRRRRTASAIAVSLGVHAAVWSSASSTAAPRAPKPQPEMELRWVTLPPLAEPETKPEPEPEPPPKPEPAPRAVEKAPSPKTPEPPPAEPTPEPELASEPPPEPAPAAPPLAPLVAPAAPGVEAPFFAARPVAGSLGTASRFSTPGGTRGAPELPRPSKAAAARLVPLRDLSRRPRPPSLDGELRKNYPPELRRQGIEGVAEVSLILNAQGRPSRIDALSESSAGFARACQNTLLGSVWSEPLDREGKPVATRLVYRCRFRIQER